MKQIKVVTTVTIEDKNLRALIGTLQEVNEQYPQFFLFKPIEDEDQATEAQNVVDKLLAANIEGLDVGMSEEGDLLLQLYQHLNNRLEEYNEDQEEDDPENEEEEEEPEDEKDDEEDEEDE